MTIKNVFLNLFRMFSLKRKKPEDNNDVGNVEIEGDAVNSPKQLNSILVSNMDQRSPIAEQYRNLRNQVLSESKINNYKILSITSSVRDEGKTTTCANLAIMLAAKPELNILIIDGDMRMPSLHKLFGIQNENGLSDLLQYKAEFESCVRNTFIDNLKMLPAGELPSSPSELISSMKMRELLSYLKTRKDIDYVLIDTPPLIPTTDPRVLAVLVDASIMVVKANKTFREAISHSLSLFGGGKVLGVVLNNLSGLSSYYPYYYSYAYGYDDYERGE